MIFIKNRVRKHSVDEEQLRKDIEILLDALNYANYDISILLTTNAGIRKYNREYRHKDKPTDIISFPYHTTLQAGQRIKVKAPEDKNLGDIVISVDYVLQEAKKLGVTFEQRLKRLLVHGVCHLLGYDHVLDQDYKIMLKKEMALLKKIIK